MMRQNRQPACAIHTLTLDDTLTLPAVFADERGEYLRLVHTEAEERALCRPTTGPTEAQTLQTANGEVTRYHPSERVFDRMVKRLTLRFEMPASCLLTGLGQHEDGVFDYTGQTEYLYQANMIISVPFVLSSAGWGLWVNAECAMRFSAEDGAFTLRLEAAENASITVLRGKDCADVLRGLASLTGMPALLPKWAYGYIQSKERYTSAQELTETAARFRQEGIGMDCIVQDWLSWRDGLWGDKTPDPVRYPSVRTLTDTLHSMNTRLMISVWPNMNAGPDHDAFARRGLMLPQSDVYDAFSPEARALYWQQCRAHWLDGGADALWCDSAEPFTDVDWRGEEKLPEPERYAAVTRDAATHMDETRLLGYGKAHCRGIAEHWRQDMPAKRVVNLCRNGYAGAAADGVIVWSGDISARWDVLARQITEGIKAACSGLAYWTLDIGGFFVCDGRVAAKGCGANGQRNPAWFWRGGYQDGADDPAYRELYARWMQFGAMLPVFRAHGTDTPREPWQFGKPGEACYNAITSAIALRYRLLPYIYSAAATACQDGLPMLRAMLTTFPEDPHTHALHQQYMLGDFLLAAPVTAPLRGDTARTAAYLPQGFGWTSYFTGERFTGGQVVQMDTPLHEFPLFVRDGAIIPVATPSASTADLPLLASGLDIYSGANGKATLYDDAGDGLAHEAGEYLRVQASWDNARRTLTLSASEGTLPLSAPIPLTLTLHTENGATCQQALTYTGTEAKITWL